MRSAAATLVAVAACVGAATASAAGQPTVCQAGCAFSSIQAAIDAAASGSTITIAAGMYDGSITITKDISLVGSGAEETTITQDGTNSVITISRGVSVTIKGVTVSGGYAFVCSNPFLPFLCTGDGGGINNAGALMLKASIVRDNVASRAGGIYNVGTMTLAQSDVRDNETVTACCTSTFAGGIFNAGTATLTSSTVDGNRASFGGGIFNELTGTLTLNHSTVSSNINNGIGPTSGGGISNSGVLTLNQSSVSNNASDETGGGIFNSDAGAIEINSSSITDNVAQVGRGGGIANDGSVRVTHSTVAGNRAIWGGGIYNTGAATLTSTTVTDNTAFLDGGGIFNSGGTVVLAGGTTISGNNPNDLAGV
jgi:hypothetical protein